MFGRDFENLPIFREGQFSEGPVLRSFTVHNRFSLEIIML
jgi:hypothetical protein